MCTGAGGCALCARGARGRGERVLCAKGRGECPLFVGGARSNTLHAALLLEAVEDVHYVLELLEVMRYML